MYMVWMNVKDSRIATDNFLSSGFWVAPAGAASRPMWRDVASGGSVSGKMFVYQFRAIR